MFKPNLLGTGGRETVKCWCTMCSHVFIGYSRWVKRGYQQCRCGLSGTAIIKKVPYV